MIISDEIANAINRVLTRYLATSVTRTIGGTSVTIRPTFISAHYRAKREASQLWVDGRRSPMKSVENAQCLRIQAYAGEGDLGHGVTEAGLNSTGEDPRGIERVLDESMDRFVKVAAAKYLEGVGESILDSKTSLEHNGRRKKTIYCDQNGTSEIQLDDLNQTIVDSGKKLLHRDRLVRISIGIANGGSLYVDTVGSTIKQNEQILSALFTLSGYDKRGKPMMINDALTFRSPEQITEKIVARKVERIQTLWEAGSVRERIPSGSYPILLDGAAVGTLVHEAIAAHLLSGAYVSNGDSNVYTPDRINTLVLPPEITIIDDPTIPGKLGSYQFDEQGTLARKAVLVEKGMLKEYLLDVSSAAKVAQYLERDVESNGRARSQWVIGREGKLLDLEPRVTNLFVEITPERLMEEDKLKEKFYSLIRDHPSGRGIYIEGGGGEVDISDGTFHIEPGAAWLVDSQGERTLLHDLILVGHTDNLFANVRGYGKPYRSGYGRCGATSGYVPTQERAPAMLLDSGTIVSAAPDTSTERLLR